LLEKIRMKNIEDYCWWEILVITIAIVIVFELGRELFIKVF